MALAVFDIDGTLVTGPGSEQRLFCLLLRRGWLSPRQLFGFLRFGLRHSLAFGRHTWKQNKAYLAGLDSDALNDLVADWVPRAAPRWWYGPAVERLRRHQARGDSVLLLSGTPQCVAAALARELGVTQALGTLCATAGGRFLAAPPVRHPFGPAKRDLVREVCTAAGIPAGEVFAYADSGYDLPLLRFVGHPVAVRPDPALRQTARAEGFEILGSR